MRLSIVVSVYNDNHDGYLEACLDSLLDQDIPVGEYEIIAVDDASTDDSLALLREYEERHRGRLRVIAREKNGGPGGGKNTGLYAASGRYVGYVDHDDIVAPGAYKKLLEAAEREDADLAGGLWAIMDPSGNQVEIGPQRVFFSTGEITDDMRRGLLVRGERFWNKIIKRKVIEDSGIWLSEGTYIDDTPATPFWMALCRSYAHVDEVVYTTRSHPDSSSRADLTYEKCLQHLVTQHRMAENCRTAGLYGLLDEALEYRYFYRGFVQSAQLCRRGLSKAEVRQYYRILREDLAENAPGFRENRYLREALPKKQMALAGLFMRSPVLYDLLLRSRGR